MKAPALEILVELPKLLILRCLVRSSDLRAGDIRCGVSGSSLCPIRLRHLCVQRTHHRPAVLISGVDPVRLSEELGRNLVVYSERLFNVSLGQGQEIVADRALERCFAKGGWALLNNIHLVQKWLGSLEQRLETYAEIYTKMAQIAKRRAEKRAAKKSAAAANEPEKAEGEEGEAPPAEEGQEGANAEGEKAEGTAEEGAEAAAAQVEEEEEEEDDDDPELKMDGLRARWTSVSSSVPTLSCDPDPVSYSAPSS